VNTRPFVFCLALLCLLAAPRSADAALSEWRTQVQVSAGSGVGTQFDFDGGLNAPASSVTLATPFSLSMAASTLNAGGYVPTLQTLASHDGTRAQAIAWGVQGYTNTTSDPLDTSLVVGLSAALTGGNDLQARVYLFEDEEFQFYTDPGTILFESTSRLWPGFESLANNPGPDGFDILRNNFSGTVDETRSFDFTVAPGDSFYVWAFLLSTADNPGEADAFSTLTASLSDPQGFTPAAVPEPGAASLLLLGAALALRRSRSRFRRPS
jgi:hypothetical protein